MADRESWIDRTKWKRRNMQHYREVSVGDAIRYLQTAQEQEDDEFKVGAILSLTCWIPQKQAAPTEGGTDAGRHQ